MTMTMNLSSSAFFFFFYIFCLLDSSSFIGCEGHQSHQVTAATNFYALNYNLDAKSTPTIKFVVFTTGIETRDNLDHMERIRPIAMNAGNLVLEEREIPLDSLYTCPDNVLVHTSWYKVQVTLDVMRDAPEAEWITTFELSSLPTDGTEIPNFSALIDQNPKVSVFLKRSGFSFAIALYKNDEATRKVLLALWAKKSTSNPVTSAFASYAFWNPTIMKKVMFI